MLYLPYYYANNKRIRHISYCFAMYDGKNEQIVIKAFFYLYQIPQKNLSGKRTPVLLIIYSSIIYSITNLTKSKKHENMIDNKNVLIYVFQRLRILLQSLFHIYNYLFVWLLFEGIEQSKDNTNCIELLFTTDFDNA